MTEKNPQHTEKISEEEQQQDGLTMADAGKSIVGTMGLLFLELIKIVVLAGITIGLVRYFLFKPFYVKGASMEPTYYQKEYLIIDELTYRFREPARGEVVVLEAPLGVKDYYLKRIIGLPGERIKIEDGKVVVYNEENPQGFALDESYLAEETPGMINLELGPDQFYVLGDNRDESFDSRRFGPIDRDLIVGKTWLRGWPLTRLGIIHAPTYEQ